MPPEFSTRSGDRYESARAPTRTGLRGKHRASGRRGCPPTASRRGTGGSAEGPLLSSRPRANAPAERAALRRTPSQSSRPTCRAGTAPTTPDAPTGPHRGWRRTPQWSLRRQIRRRSRRRTVGGCRWSREQRRRACAANPTARTRSPPPNGPHNWCPSGRRRRTSSQGRWPAGLRCATSRTRGPGRRGCPDGSTTPAVGVWRYRPPALSRRLTPVWSRSATAHIRKGLRRRSRRPHPDGTAQGQPRGLRRRHRGGTALGECGDEHVGSLSRVHGAAGHCR